MCTMHASIHVDNKASFMSKQVKDTGVYLKCVSTEEGKPLT